MKRAIVPVLTLLSLAALAVGGWWLWGRRPWRTAIEVNGRALTASELELRTRTLYEDAIRVEHLAVAHGHEGEALEKFRRDAAKMWIVKEVMLGEAVARGITVTAADEQESLALTAVRLKSRNSTPEAYFKEGPLPEDIKRRDFREGILIHKFTKGELSDKTSVTTQEIDQRMTELKKIAQMSKGKGKPKIKTDRKTAIDMLRAEKFRQEFRQLFRTLFVKADVRCPEFPDLEQVDGVSPSRPEDNEAPSVPTKEKGAAK